MSIREFREATLDQGEDERIAYALTTTPWGGSPSSPVVVVKLGGADVTGTVATGSPTVAGDVITTPVIHSLEDGQRYRLEIKWTHPDGHVLEAYGHIRGRV